MLKTLSSANNIEVSTKDYTILNNAPLVSSNLKDKIQLTEFFSYACVHCQDLEPKLNQYLAIHKNINLTKIQIVYQDYYQAYAKLCATVAELKLNALNPAIYNAIIEQRLKLEDEVVLKQFLQNNKIDLIKFMNIYNSFAISARVAEYARLTKVYNITGTPTFIVANKYLLNPATPDRLIAVIDALTKKK